MKLRASLILFPFLMALTAMTGCASDAASHTQGQPYQYVTPVDPHLILDSPPLQAAARPGQDNWWESRNDGRLGLLNTPIELPFGFSHSYIYDRQSIHSGRASDNYHRIDRGIQFRSTHH